MKTIRLCKKCQSPYTGERCGCIRGGKTGRVSLFGTGFIQVFLVSVQTYFITTIFLPGVLVVGFLISYVWTFNVKKVAFGNKSDRVVYASGAAVGAFFGVISGMVVKKLFSVSCQGTVP